MIENRDFPGNDPELKTDKSESEPPAEEKRSVDEIIAFAETVLSGMYTGHAEDYSNTIATGETTVGPPDDFDPAILDTKQDHYTPDEQQQLLDWLTAKLEMPISAAPRSAVYEHIEEPIQLRVFAKQFGTPENPWNIAEAVDINEEGHPVNPLYYLTSPTLLEYQAEIGYLPVEDNA